MQTAVAGTTGFVDRKSTGVFSNIISNESIRGLNSRLLLMSIEISPAEQGQS